MKIICKVLGVIQGKWRSIRCALNPVKYARSQGVRVGRDCRLIKVSFGSEPYLVSLGDHVSATDVNFITHDGGPWVFRAEHPDIDVIAPIKVGNNVFLGAGTTVLPGVTIGDNVIIGAGAVVTKDIPSNCVAVGVPAMAIKNLNEYWNSIQNNIIRTKGMNKKAKREYLLKHFGELAKNNTICGGENR